ncbi:ABC transporter substrate-binding protein [Silvanigrella aquatica]|uniref:Sugar ABC transporter n=1 Tax=Silvanigrella aquatica TaxID=1915309 RepID=A0A1L4D3U5_9BACT|nr:hypothetical protein [Silvanigrella aquatica]APJ04886.1 hypothetical protein AXG55_13680 [Silvanigrella aquatica]
MIKKYYIPFFKLILLIFGLISINSFAGNKDIIIVESYSKEYKWDADYAKEIRNAFGRKYNLTFFEMDTKRLPKDQHEKMGLKAWDLIQKVKPTMVFIGDDAALKYVGPKLEQNKIRTVYLGINNNPRVYFDKEPKYITGVLERPLIRRSAIFIKDIIPQSKKILVLFDSDITSKIVHEDFFSGKPSINFSGINYDIYLFDKFADWQRKIIDAPHKGYEAIIVGLYANMVDENKKNVDSVKVVQWSAANSKLPIFSFWDFTVGKGKALGGLVMTGASQGKALVEMAQKLLNNPTMNPSSLYPIYLQEGKFVFSKYEMKRHKIKLPADIEKEAIYTE